MSYRKKIPHAKDLRLHQQLNKFFNASVGVPFEPHFAKHLMEYAAKSLTQSGARQNFVPMRLVKKGTVKKGVEPIKLPLPKFFIDPSDSPADFEPREFYHSDNLLKDVEFDQKIFPRCGVTGLFFSREEVIDSLLAAATDLNFTSPFWIDENYPQLLSGYVSLKDDSGAILVSVTSSVASIESIKDIDPTKLHPSLSKYQNSKRSLDLSQIEGAVPKGMNIFTGFVSKNSYIQSLPHNGLWYSYSQAINMNLKTVNADDFFTLVEVDQLSLFNADQLTVPGRLGLKRKALSPTLFTPL